MLFVRLTVFCILITIFPQNSFAQFSVLPRAGMTQESPFYFGERFLESIRTFFIFGSEKKVERFIILAEERLSEAVSLAEMQSSYTENAIKDFNDQFAKAVKEAERSNNAELKGKVLESLAKHFSVFEDILDSVPEAVRVIVEAAYEAERKLQKRFLFDVASEDPLYAAELGFASIRERLVALKSEVEAGRRYETSISASHVKDIFDVLVSAGVSQEKKSTAFFSLVAKDITRALETFDDIERSPKRPPPEIGQNIVELKARLIELQINLSHDMISVDPPFVVEVLREAMQSRIAALDRIRKDDETNALFLFSEYEQYLLFSKEVLDRSGRYILNREEQRTVGTELNGILTNHLLQLQQKKALFSPSIQGGIDRLIILIDSIS